MSARKFLITAAAAFAAVTAIADTAAAEGQAEIVSYGDLNLSSREGVDTLNDRIRRAAQRICASEPGTAALGLREVMECRREAVAAASVTRDQAITRFAGTGVAQVRAVR